LILALEDNSCVLLEGSSFTSVTLLRSCLVYIKKTDFMKIT
jgi:hypothetical protein